MAFDDPQPTRAFPSAPNPSAPRGPSRRLVVSSLLTAAVAGAVVGALGSLADPDDGTVEAAPTDGAAAPEPIEPASVQSFDPVGGSGLRDEGDGSWSTQTYRTEDFGKLKPGVGLLLDLGSAREVTAVTLPTASTGLAVQLLAGDQPPAGDVSGMTSVAGKTTADGPTELSGAEGGSHRYWMVWVTRLAPSGDGFGATVATPQIEGPAAQG